MDISVFLGSNPGRHPSYQKATQALGVWLAKNKHRLIYGGSQDGLMGVLAQALVDAGGQVVGVLPDNLKGIEKPFAHLSEVVHVPDIPSRIQVMIEKGQAFIALPGGVGTLEEIFRVISMVRLREIQAPCIFLNVNHYYDSLDLHFKKMVEEGFLPSRVLNDVHFVESFEEVHQILENS